MPLGRLTLLLPARSDNPTGPSFDDPHVPFPVQAPAPGSSTERDPGVAAPWQVSLAQCLHLQQRSTESAEPDDSRAIEAESVPAGLTLPWEFESSLLPGSSVLRADPVHLIPDRDSAVLIPAESLQLTEIEITSIRNDLNAFLVEDGLVLHTVHPHRWYLTGEGLCSMPRLPPEQVAFTELDVHAKEGSATGGQAHSAQRRLRLLSSEIEMLLFSHPVNEERRARSQPTVSGLYLWGSLDKLHKASDNAVLQVVGDDPWVRCAADIVSVGVSTAPDFKQLLEQLRVQTEGEPNGLVADVVVVEFKERAYRLASKAEAAEDARASFEFDWIEPARTALHTGELQEIVFQHDDGWRRCERAGRRRLLTRLLSRAFRGLK